MHPNHVLIVLRGRKDFGFFAGNGGVAIDNGFENTAGCFNSQSQRGHIQQEHVFDVAGHDGALNGGTNGDDFVGVDALYGGLAKNFLGAGSHAGHARHAAHQQDCRKVTGLKAGIAQGALARIGQTLD